MIKQPRPAGWAVTGQGPKNSVAWKRTEGSAPAGPARVYLHDADLTLYNGDALEVLRQLPDESVHMCVTSPPFYGLRDYGTGRWEGGDPECDHSNAKKKGRADYGFTSDVQPNNPHAGYSRYESSCECGASRIDLQIGLEASPEEWCAKLVEVFREVRRVLRADGTCWVEVGDSYAAGKNGRADGDRRGVDGFTGGRKHEGEPFTQRVPPAGMKAKDLIGAPWMLAFALRADGWYLRSDVVWSRPNPMPESVTDRPTKSHSYVFLLAKSKTYFFDQEAVREPHARLWGENNGGSWAHPERQPEGSKAGHHSGPYPAPNPSGRNVRSVWSIATEAYPDAHFATYPQELVRRCILAGTSERGCCPECGAPWEREVEQGEPPENYTPGHTPAFKTRRFASATGGYTRPTSTLGWLPSCECGGDRTADGTDGSTDPVRLHGTAVPAPIAATVLDPFAGSGTTGLVARKHGRRSVLIELSADYCELVARRTQQLSLTGDAV